MNKFNIDSIIEPVKPSKPMSAYMFYVKQIMDDRDMTVKAVVTEISHKAGEQWKAMGDKEKEPFKKLNESDKKRYEDEVAQFEAKGFFVNKDGVSSLDLAMSNPKFKPEVVQPKRVSTPYQCYMKSQYNSIQADLKKENPAATMLDVSSKISELWSNMDDKQRRPFVAMSEKDRERYDAQIKELLTKGYFVNEQGVKSSDLKKKVKRSKKAEKTEDAAADDASEDNDGGEDDAEEEVKPKKKRGASSKKVGVKRARPESAGSDEPDEAPAEPKKKRTRKE